MGECSSSRIKLFELSRMLCDESDDPIRVLRTVLAETGTGHGESESSGSSQSRFKLSTCTQSRHSWVRGLV
jgi:hypothetical protein